MSGTMKRDETRNGTAARWLRRGERLLGVLGVLCLGAYSAACVSASLTQASEEDAFEAALRQRLQVEEYDQREWTPQRIEHYEQARGSSVEALGRLEVPSAGVSVMVLDGTDDWTLNRAVGRIEGTAAPGQRGNMGIAGHRDAFFRGLRHVELGDEISLTTLDGIASYRVTKLDIVKPETVEVLDPTPDHTLTLVTCHPFYYVGDAPNRFIVTARRVSFLAWDKSAAASGIAAR
jgi:LPXTG-site transpeptidase (sortase) family protein